MIAYSRSGTRRFRRQCYPKYLIRLASLRLTFLVAVAAIASAQPSVLLDAMSQELNRNFSILKEKADPPPYFMSYEVTEQEVRSVSGTLGALTGFEGGKERFLDVSVRVGTPKLDNYHRVRGDRGQFTMGAPLTFEDNVNSIKRRLWLDTARAYRAAAERLIRIKTNTQVKVAAEDDSDDFSSDKAVTAEEPLPKLKFNEEEWTQRIRKLSARFQNYPSVLTSHVSATAQTDTRYLVNTE